MQYFKSIMPPKLGNVVDCKNIPINTEAVAYENRVKKLFIKLFGGGMIEEEIYLNTLIAEAQLQMTIGYIAFGMCVMLGITLWIYRR